MPATIRCPSCTHVFVTRDTNPTPTCPQCGTTVHRSTLPDFIPPNPPTVPQGRNRPKNK